MSIYLNTDKPFESYKELVNEKYFVDKSSMITLLNQRISTKSKYICVTPFIVELKKDESTEAAINQIKEKEYVEKFRIEDKEKKVLAVAICYDSKSKEHRCRIEEI